MDPAKGSAIDLEVLKSKTIMHLYTILPVSTEGTRCIYTLVSRLLHHFVVRCKMIWCLLYLVCILLPNAPKGAWGGGGGSSKCICGQSAEDI